VLKVEESSAHLKVAPGKESLYLKAAEVRVVGLAGFEVIGWNGFVAPKGTPREVYLHHVVDNDWCMSEYDSQAVVWQTAINPVLALELLDTGAWKGVGLLGPEAMPAEPFLDLLKDCGAPWALDERTPS